MNEVATLENGEAHEVTPMSMLDRALTSGADVETLDKLMALQERWQDREAKAAYDADMAAMQGDLPVIEKTRPGDGTKWKYADWGDIKRKINPVLQKHGFAVTHRTEARENDIVVTAICSHKSGHREETSLPLPYDTSGSKNATQARGSSVQYGVRYTGCAIIGVAVSGEDKDGADPNAPPPEEEAHDILAMIDAAPILDNDGFRNRMTEQCKKKNLSPAAFKLVKAKYAEALRDEKLETQQ